MYAGRDQDISQVKKKGHRPKKRPTRHPFLPDQLDLSQCQQGGGVRMG